MSEHKFGRLATAMVTPFDQNLDLDFERAELLAERLVEGGTDSIVICGTTGESPTISHREKIELMKVVIKAVDGRVPVIANVGDNCTANTIDFTAEASKLGVNGCMCVVPYYNKPPQEGLYKHFRAIAESTDLPIMLYNIPGRCATNMTEETTLRLAHDVPNIVAVKEASGNFDQVKRIIDGAPEGFEVFSGDDASTYDLMKMGAVGVVSTISNVATARMKEIVDACASGEWSRAQRLNDGLLPLMEALFKTTNPILVKEALKQTGFDVGGVRMPLVDATAEQIDTLVDAMETVGVL